MVSLYCIRLHLTAISDVYSKKLKTEGWGLEKQEYKAKWWTPEMATFVKSLKIKCVDEKMKPRYVKENRYQLHFVLIVLLSQMLIQLLPSFNLRVVGANIFLNVNCLSCEISGNLIIKQLSFNATKTIMQLDLLTPSCSSLYSCKGVE